MFFTVFFNLCVLSHKICVYLVIIIKFSQKNLKIFSFLYFDTTFYGEMKARHMHKLLINLLKSITTFRPITIESHRKIMYWIEIIKLWKLIHTPLMNNDFTVSETTIIDPVSFFNCLFFNSRPKNWQMHPSFAYVIVCVLQGK